MKTLSKREKIQLFNQLAYAREEMGYIIEQLYCEIKEEIEKRIDKNIEVLSKSKWRLK